MTVVLDLDRQPVIRDDRDPAVSSGGMANDIRQGLDGDPIGGHFHGSRQVGELGGSLDRHLRHRLLEPIGLLTKCPHEPQLVERGRPKPFDQLPNVGQRLVHLGPQSVQQQLGGVGVPPECFGGRLGPHADGRQRRTEAVVEVPPEPPSLLLPGSHEALARTKQVLPQPDRMDRRSCLASEVLEETELIGPEAILAGPGRHDEPAHGL